MPPEWFHSIVKNSSLQLINNHWIDPSLPASSWSFNEEWKEYATTRQQKTWDLTAVQRLEHFYKETATPEEQLPGKLVLDAGCGNGQLTQAIAATGAWAVGIDRQPYLPANNDRVQFVQADFGNPPFLPGTFDIIIANGSIHHTPDSFHAFQSLASLVKKEGKLYVWVYKKQKGRMRFLVWWLDICRFFISRFPPWLQRFKVNALTNFFYLLSRVRRGENSKRSKDEIRINVYDAFTPRYRHYHTREEVREWFAICGFGQVQVTHDHNKYGFGMLGIKEGL